MRRAIAVPGQKPSHRWAQFRQIRQPVTRAASAIDISTKEKARPKPGLMASPITPSWNQVVGLTCPRNFGPFIV